MVYMISHFNIGTKASVLIYEKLNCVAGVYILKGCKKRNLNRVDLANQRTCPKNQTETTNIEG